MINQPFTISCLFVKVVNNTYVHFFVRVDAERRLVLEAMKHWEDHTCIRFQQRTTQRVYVNIFPGSGYDIVCL